MNAGSSLLFHLSSSAFICGSLLFSPTAPAAPPEVRATWLTTTANDAIASPFKTQTTMRRLREIGLNTVYVECWKNGYTAFPSPTLQRAIGVEMKVNGGPDARQRDLLGEAVLHAHRNGLLAVGWFEYGFMAAFRDTHNELRAKREWITTAADGSDVSPANGFVWLNPFHPDVQQFLIDLSLDAVRQYDLDGVQLDDRIALPVDLGYDPYTRELYRKETGSYPPDDARDPKWMTWRADKISEFALRYVTELRAANPDLLLSVSPAPYPWSYDHYLCDWLRWTRWCYCGGKRWDEYVPQCYRLDAAATIQSVKAQVDQVDQEKQNLVPGLRVVGEGPDTSFDDLKQSIEFCRTQGVAGHALWFSRGVLDVHPDALAAFYDVERAGPAASPFRPADWRPTPIVATRGDEPDAWTATVVKAGRYQLIAQQNGTWSSIATLDLKAGEHTFVQAGEAVELLVDRRP